MKALVGSWEQRPHRLLAETAALRTRVEELQHALQRAHEENDQLRAALATAMDQLELHAAAPAERDGDALDALLAVPEAEQVALSRS